MQAHKSSKLSATTADLSTDAQTREPSEVTAIRALSWDKNNVIKYADKAVAVVMEDQNGTILN